MKTQNEIYAAYAKECKRKNIAAWTNIHGWVKAEMTPAQKAIYDRVSQ